MASTNPNRRSYAAQEPDLPGSDFHAKLREFRIARQFAEAQAPAPRVQAMHTAKAGSHMVANDRPAPTPRPSPAWSSDVDRESFDTRWAAERTRASQSIHPDQTKGDASMTNDTDQKPRPVETLREGALKAAIWRNEGENGIYHAVTLSRGYKDQDGNLQDTASFRPKDMLGLAELTRQAHYHAYELDRAAFKEQRRDMVEMGRSQPKTQTR